MTSQSSDADELRGLQTPSHHRQLVAAVHPWQFDSAVQLSVSGCRSTSDSIMSVRSGMDKSRLGLHATCSK
jgi:hypothetical protein